MEGSRNNPIDLTNPVKRTHNLRSGKKFKPDSSISEDDVLKNKENDGNYDGKDKNLIRSMIKPYLGKYCFVLDHGYKMADFILKHCEERDKKKIFVVVGRTCNSKETRNDGLNYLYGEFMEEYKNLVKYKNIKFDFVWFDSDRSYFPANRDADLKRPKDFVKFLRKHNTFRPKKLILTFTQRIGNNPKANEIMEKFNNLPVEEVYERLVAKCLDIDKDNIYIEKTLNRTNKVRNMVNVVIKC